MKPAISYGKLLFYHFIIGLIGVAVSLLLFGIQIYRIFVKIIDVIRSESIMPESEFLYIFFVEIMGGALLISLLSIIITKFITAGLSYIPYLYKTNNLSVKSILRMSFKKGYAVILFYVIAYLISIVISIVLSFIPILNIVLGFGISYLMGLFCLWLDYHLSRNALHGQKTFSYMSFNSQQLFKRTKKEREVFITPLYYMAASIVGAANLFIRPLFQLRIIQILDDEEQAFITPPPQTYWQIPNPPPTSPPTL